MIDARARTPVPLFLIASVIWGSTWLAIKFQLGVVAADVSVAYRFALAAAIFLAWCAITRRPLRFTARQHRWIAAQGILLFSLNYIGIYWAEEYVTSGLVAVLFSTIVFMNPIAARWLFGTPLGPRMLLAAALGVGGVALLFLPDLLLARQGGSAGLGVAYGLGATAIACAGNMLAVRNNRAGLPVLPSTAWGMLYGAAVAAVGAWIHGSTWNFDLRLPYVASLAYLALFGSVVAFGAYLTLLKRVGPGPASYVGVGTPIVALALSTLLEGYRWTPVALLGAMLAISGNLVALKAPRPKSASIADTGSS